MVQDETLRGLSPVRSQNSVVVIVRIVHRRTRRQPTSRRDAGEGSLQQWGSFFYPEVEREGF